MFERIHPDFGRKLSWKWGVLGFAAVPYASVAFFDTAAALARIVASGFGYELPREVWNGLRLLGALPGQPLADVLLRVFLLTDSWLLASMTYYTLLVLGAVTATAAVRRLQPGHAALAAQERDGG